MYTIEASRCIAACVPFQTKEVADPPARAGVPARFSGKRRARRHRMSVRFGAMVAELSP
jgi:hypothetical protein